MQSTIRGRKARRRAVRLALILLMTMAPRAFAVGRAAQTDCAAAFGPGWSTTMDEAGQPDGCSCAGFFCDGEASSDAVAAELGQLLTTGGAAASGVRPAFVIIDDPGGGEGGGGGGGGGGDGGGGGGGQDPGNGDPGSGDPGTGDPGTGDPGTGDPGTGDPGTGDQGNQDPGHVVSFAGEQRFRVAHLGAFADDTAFSFRLRDDGTFEALDGFAHHYEGTWQASPKGTRLALTLKGGSESGLKALAAQATALLGGDPDTLALSDAPQIELRRPRQGAMSARLQMRFEVSGGGKLRRGSYTAKLHLAVS